MVQNVCQERGSVKCRMKFCWNIRWVMSCYGTWRLLTSRSSIDVFRSQFVLACIGHVHMCSLLCQMSQRLICFVDVPPLLTVYIVISFRTVSIGWISGLYYVMVTSEGKGVGILWTAYMNNDTEHTQAHADMSLISHQFGYFWHSDVLPNRCR